MGTSYPKQTHIDYNQEMDYLTAHAFLILGSISTLSSLFLFIILLVSKPLKKPPGNFVRWIAFSDLQLSIHYTVSAFFTEWIYNKTFSSDSYYCIVQSAVASFAGSMEYLYNVFFMLYKVIKFRNLINNKGSNIYFIAFHFIGWIVPAGNILNF